MVVLHDTQGAITPPDTKQTKSKVEKGGTEAYKSRADWSLEPLINVPHDERQHAERETSQEYQTPHETEAGEQRLLSPGDEYDLLI